MYGSEDLFGHLRLYWMWWPAIGGIGIGIGGIFFPADWVWAATISPNLQGNAPGSCSWV
jgi:H+/Cl- antiporter ClcA